MVEHRSEPVASSAGDDGRAEGVGRPAPGLPEEMARILEWLAAGEEIRVADLDHGVEVLGEDGFAGTTLGLQWDTLASDRVTAHLDVDERHHQPYGIVHGGVWCSMIESMASIAAALRIAPAGKLCVGVSNATDFLRSHRSGRIDGVATPVHVGRLQQLWQVELTRADDGKAVARGQVRLQNVELSQLGS